MCVCVCVCARARVFEFKEELVYIHVLLSIPLQTEVDLTMLPLPASHFHSDQPKDQCLLNVHVGPSALLRQYHNAMEKPALHVFTPLRDDGKNALHLYSNPEFFFGHWRSDMEKKAARKRQSGILESSVSTLSSRAAALHDNA